MLGRMRLYVLSLWFVSWSEMAERRRALWERRGDRWRTRSEKFFQRVKGGRE